MAFGLNAAQVIVILLLGCSFKLLQTFANWKANMDLFGSKTRAHLPAHTNLCELPPPARPSLCRSPPRCPATHCNLKAHNQSDSAHRLSAGRGVQTSYQSLPFLSCSPHHCPPPLPLLHQLMG